MSGSGSKSVLELSPVLIPYVLGFFIFRGFFSNFPLYLQLKFNLTDVAAVQMWGEIGSVAFFFGAFSRLPAGLISDRLGRIRSFALAYTIYILALLLIYFTDMSIYYMIALSSIRFGVNTFAMTGRAIVSTSNRDKGLKNGLLSAMVGLGSFSGPFLFAFILDHYPPDTIVVVALVIILSDIILFVIMLNSIPRLFRKIYPDDEPETDYTGVKMVRSTELTSAIFLPGIRSGFVLFASAGLIYGLVDSVYSIYGYNVIGLQLSLVGLIAGSGSLVQIVWAPIVGKLYDYVKDDNMRVLGWTISLIATILISLSKFGLVFFILGFFVLSFGNSTYFTMEITRIGRVVSKSQFSFIFGITASMSILGTAIASYIAPYFYRIIPEGTFILTLFISIPSLLYSLYMKFSKKE